MGGLAAVSVTIGIRVRDLEEASRWCTEIFGKPHDIEPVPGIREWKVTAGTWVQLAEDPGTGGRELGAAHRGDRSGSRAAAAGGP
jgi:hypothetical protein